MTSAGCTAYYGEQYLRHLHKLGYPLTDKDRIEFNKSFYDQILPKDQNFERLQVALTSIAKFARTSIAKLRFPFLYFFRSCPDG